MSEKLLPTMVMPFPECLQALRAIQPREFIAYGKAFNIKTSAYNQDASDEERAVRRLIEDLDGEMRIMRFQIRISNKNVLLVALGVDPSVREKLEQVLKRVPVPKLKIPSFY